MASFAGRYNPTTRQAVLRNSEGFNNQQLRDDGYTGTLWKHNNSPKSKEMLDRIGDTGYLPEDFQVPTAGPVNAPEPNTPSEEAIQQPQTAPDTAQQVIGQPQNNTVSGNEVIKRRPSNRSKRKRRQEASGNLIEYQYKTLLGE